MNKKSARRSIVDEVEEVCPNCGGDGKTAVYIEPDNTCTRCKGTGFVVTRRTYRWEKS